MTSKKSADDLMQWESHLREAAHNCELRAGIEADRRNMASIVGSINEYSRKEYWT